MDWDDRRIIALTPNFCQKVAAIMRYLRPGTQVDIVSTDTLVVDGRKVQLAGIYDIVNCYPEQAEPLIERFLSQISAYNSAIVDGSISDFKSVEDRIFPRIWPIKQSVNLAGAAYVPFVHGTIIAFVIDLQDAVVSISKEQMEGWRQTPESLEEIAKSNLQKLTGDLTFDLIRASKVDADEPDSQSSTIFIARSDGYDSSRILLPSLYETVAPMLGGDFNAIIPCRDVLMVFSRKEKSVIEACKSTSKKIFETRPYSITPEVFLVTMDGISQA